jgi:hypothetical protein
MPRADPPTLLQSLFGARRSLGPEVLALRVGEACELNSGLAQRFIRCELAYAVEVQGKVSCTWRIEGPSEGEGLHIVFQGPDGKTWAARFGVYRHTANRDIALLGTCAGGDVFGLFHQGEQAG